jgi:hypothetical protein
MANKMTSKVFVAVLGFFGIAMATLPAEAQQASATTAIPVIFTHTLKAGKDKQGEPIVAKTLQNIVLPSGQQLPKGAVLKGRIVASRAFVFDPTPYVEQKPSVLSLRFENASTGGQSIPLRLSVRAMASPQETADALTVRYKDENDFVGTKTLVGGDVFATKDTVVRSAERDIVAYVRKDGVYARLLASTNQNADGTIRCDATSTEQAVGVFSPHSCGLYGYESAFLSNDGKDSKGVFTIESTHDTVWIESGSSAFLQLID